MYDSLPSRFGGGGRGGDRRGGGYGGGGGGRGGGGGGGGREKFNTPGSSLRKPNWDMNALPRFEKNFYRESPSVQARSMQVLLLTLLFMYKIFHELTPFSPTTPH